MIHIIETRVCNQRDRKILRRVMTDGLTYEQAAEEAGCSRGTVYNVIHRHKNKFV